MGPEIKTSLTQIKKRDGRIVPFEIEKMVSAIQKAMRASGEGTIKEAREVAAAVAASISVVDGMVPTVERIQDETEKHLILGGYAKTSKSYILYRAERSKIREERGGIPRQFKKLAEESKKYFENNPLGQFVYLRTYARWIEEEQRRETWIETVDRYVDFMRENLGKKLTDEEYVEIREAILKQEVMPSMRAMQFSGEPARRCNTCFYNCSYVAPTLLEDFAEIMYLSMQGCGVGFSVESEAIQQLPQIKKQKGVVLPNYVVEDSREGWCNALTEGLVAWYAGKDIEFDYSKVRPAGTRLKTQGGKASGPEPLQSLLVFARDRILKRQGRRLRNIDAHDIICKIGECVVAGGVRRTAMISLSDLDDADMRDAKKGQFFLTDQHRSVANNSAVYEHKPTNIELMDEWVALMKSGSGERGIFNRGGFKSQMPKRRIKYLEDKYGKDNFDLTGTNPCFHPDTLIETVDGRKAIKDITKPTSVYSMDDNGKLVISSASAAWKTRENATVVKITISTGKTLIVTPEHQIFIVDKGWVMAKNLSTDDVIVHLSRQRRGARYIGIKLTSEPYNAFRMEHRFVWEGASGQIVSRGFDIHHVDNNTHNNSIDNLSLMSHSQHATLTRFSCANDHQVKGLDGKFVSPLDSNKGQKDILDLPESLKAGLVNQFPKVVSVEDAGTSDVYDISVSGYHNVIANYIVAHNCGEISLQSKEFCNLSEVIARFDDTEESLLRKTRLATILGTYQSSLAKFKYISKEWTENVKDERLLGVSITGQWDCPVVRSAEILQKMRELAIEVNKEYAKRLGINQSTSITCVKPSGTVSQTFNCSSGLHPRNSRFYIRRIRISATDSLFKLAKDQGIPYFPEVGQNAGNANTFVLEFPVKSPDGSTFKNDISAIDQLEYWKMVKLNWTEHNPSATVSIGDDEWIGVIDWIQKNWDIVGGLSFLPREKHVYRLAPYEEITEEEYNRRSASFPVVDYSKLVTYERTDETEQKRELACQGGTCEIE